jgi:hypothetical protein
VGICGGGVMNEMFGGGLIVDCGWCEVCGDEKEVLVVEIDEVEGVCRDCWLVLCDRMKEGVM